MSIIRRLLKTVRKKNKCKHDMVSEFFDMAAYQRVVTTHGENKEIFDLLQLGIFHSKTSMRDQTHENQTGLHDLPENLELVGLQPRAEYRRHFHKNSSALIYIIAGSGMFHYGNRDIEYQSGMRVIIPAGTLHGFTTQSRTFFLSIQTPPIIHPVHGEIDIHYPE